MPKSSRGRHGVRKNSVPNIIGQSYNTTTQTFITNLGFISIPTTTNTSTASDDLIIYSQGLSNGSVVPFGTNLPYQYYVYVAPFFPYFPPFFPFFPPYFPPFFPFFPPYFPPFFPYFPPFFPPRFGPFFPACVDGDTLILTSEGTKPARDIKAGDTLLTVNAEALTAESNATPLQINVEDLKITGLVHTQITNVIVSDKSDRVYFNDNKETQFTETHPIFVKRNNEYRVIEAGSVVEGDILININIDELSEPLDIKKAISEVAVSKVNKKTLDVAKDVYTFSCNPYNWYFAGTILTHNK